MTCTLAQAFYITLNVNPTFTHTHTHIDTKVLELTVCPFAHLADECMYRGKYWDIKV